MKQSLERSTTLLSIERTKLFLVSFALFSLALPFFACVTRSRDANLSSKPSEPTPQTTKREANDQQPAASPQTAAPSQQSPQRININTASEKELEKLPGIGKGLAARIVEHREKYGPFRRPEHLIIVRGISDRRFRAMQDLITVR